MLGVGLGEGEHAAADLDGRVRLDAHHRRAGARRRATGPAAYAPSTETTAAAPAARRRCDATASSCVGLVGEHDEVGALGELARWSATASPPSSSTSAAARPEPLVGGEHGLAPAARQRACHVARPDAADLHDGLARYEPPTLSSG